MTHISQEAIDLLKRNSAAYQAGESSVPSGAALSAIQEALEYKAKLQEAIRVMGEIANTELVPTSATKLSDAAKTFVAIKRKAAQFVKENT